MRGVSWLRAPLGGARWGFVLIALLLVSMVISGLGPAVAVAHADDAPPAAESTAPPPPVIQSSIDGAVTNLDGTVVATTMTPQFFAYAYSLPDGGVVPQTAQDVHFAFEVWDEPTSGEASRVLEGTDAAPQVFEGDIPLYLGTWTTPAGDALLVDTRYRYRVRTSVGASTGDWSAWETFRIIGSPAVPSEIQPADAVTQRANGFEVSGAVSAGQGVPGDNVYLAASLTDPVTGWPGGDCWSAPVAAGQRATCTMMNLWRSGDFELRLKSLRRCHLIRVVGTSSGACSAATGGSHCRGSLRFGAALGESVLGR